MLRSFIALVIVASSLTATPAPVQAGYDPGNIGGPSTTKGTGTR